MRPITLILIYLICYSPLSKAQDSNPAELNNCKEIRNINSRLGPIRDQNNVGWCFANTAADLLTYAHYESLQKANQSNPTPEDLQVSGIFAALHYYNSEIKNLNHLSDVFNTGGFILKTISVVQNSGFVCPQSLDTNLIGSGLKLGLKEKFYVFNRLYNLYNQIHDNSNLNNLEMIQSKKIDFDNLMAQLKVSNSLISHLTEEQFKQILTTKTFDQATMTMSEVLCGQMKVPLEKKVNFEEYNRYTYDKMFFYDSRNKSKISEEQTFKDIDFILEHEKPVAISYQVDSVLNEPKVASENHASVISGRKIINGQCHYQIRNSWGNKCTGDFEINNKTYKNHQIYKYLCENGTFWIPREDLKKISEGFIYDSSDF
ncbi:MAG: hypothetical protein L6Q37_12650 [Bdellovibrionaceae bacterium]|nr:hypothetical protein [Pseudobdellovibrionaceae bacterium]NUM59496.1 hypothetical protein [Pseudobdellovibrionaceae bacterium]